jgi:hypothetical protein
MAYRSATARKPGHFIRLMSYASTLLQLAALAVLTSCTSQPDATSAPAAPARTAAATTRYAGEYRWRDADNKEMGGTLTVYPESDSTILFYLESNDGAPAYHMANALGRARLRGDTATYFGKAAEDKYGCRLKIGFGPTSAQVLMVSGSENDCFFGGSFTPAGTYQRTSRAIPQQVIDDTGDTLHFAHLPPDVLNNSH